MVVLPRAACVLSREAHDGTVYCRAHQGTGVGPVLQHRGRPLGGQGTHCLVPRASSHVPPPTTAQGTVARIEQLLSGQRGSAMDKLRLVLVFLLTCEELPSDAEVQRLESTLSALGADMHAFSYVLRMRKMKLTGQKVPPSQSYAEGLGALSSQSNNLLNWADKTFGQGLSSLTKGVKNLLAGEQQAAVTVAVEQLMGGGTPEKEDTFAYFDPKVGWHDGSLCSVLDVHMYCVRRRGAVGGSRDRSKRPLCLWWAAATTWSMSRWQRGRSGASRQRR